jgi:hypothetical protein
MSDNEPDREGERAAAALRREIADARARIGADALRMFARAEPRSFEPRPTDERGGPSR